MKKISGKALWFWLIAAIAILLYLIFANRIIAWLFVDTPLPEEVDITTIPTIARTLSGVDVITLESPVLQTVDITGWAVSENAEDNADKYIDVFLVSDTKSYHAGTAERLMRNDLINTLGRSMPMVGGNHGFSATFSMLLMDDGVYDVYVFSHENDGAYGLCNTGRRLIKNGSDVGELAPKRIDNFARAATNTDIEGAIEGFISESRLYRVAGWAILPDVPSAQVEVFLEIVNSDGETRTYETFPTTRHDLAGTYGEGHVESGFETAIPEEELPWGEYDFNIVVVSGGNEYRAPFSKKAYISEENGWGFLGTDPYSFDNIATEAVTDTITQDAYLTQNARMGLDLATNSDSHLLLEGWVLLFMQTEAEQEMTAYVRLVPKEGETLLYELLLYPRGDIEDRHIDFPPAVDSAGFRGRVPLFELQKLGEGDRTFTLEFYVKRGGQVYQMPMHYDFAMNSFHYVGEPVEVLDESPAA